MLVGGLGILISVYDKTFLLVTQGLIVLIAPVDVGI